MIPNPFIDPNDGHVLADDAEKRREAANVGGVGQGNPFLEGVHPETGEPPYGVPMTSPAVRLKTTRGGRMKVVVGSDE